MRWLFPGKDISIDTRCLDCGERITVRMRNEKILEVHPKKIVGHVNIPFAGILKGEVSWGKG